MTDPVQHGAHGAPWHAGMMPPAPPGEDTAPLDAIEVQAQVEALNAYAYSAVLGNLLGVSVVVTLFGELVPVWWLVGWAGVFAGLLVTRSLLAGAYRLLTPARPDLLRRLRQPWYAVMLLTAAAWGWGAWAFYPHASHMASTALLLVVYCYCVGAVPVAATMGWLSVGMVGLAFMPTVYRVATQPGPDGPVLATVLMLIMGVTVTLGRSYRRAFRRRISLRREADELVRQLREESASAQRARTVAEQANEAKSRFFAAASHDLRQPLHALALFTDALRMNLQLPAHAAQRSDDQVLARQISESVGALERLFSHMLDVDRIDSGSVRSDAHPLRVADVYARLERVFSPIAGEKGLDLRFHGARHMITADPTLLDRVVGNLVANAIRYTNRGGVLVSARRVGDRVRLQAWDTGIGIRTEQQARIFDEFYQIAADAPEMTMAQRRGHGLGLAIVKRLAGVMQAPLTLRSRPGRGTVFTLELPCTPALAHAVVRPGEPAVSVGARRVLIVDPDTCGAAALATAMQRWGAQVTCLPSRSAALDWLGALASTGSLDLLMVSRRLERPFTSEDLVAAFRDRIGSTLPVIVMLEEAEVAVGMDSGCIHVLRKPVPVHKVRALLESQDAAAHQQVVHDWPVANAVKRQAAA